jgi:hypothetical protein
MRHDGRCELSLLIFSWILSAAAFVAFSVPYNLNSRERLSRMITLNADRTNREWRRTKIVSKPVLALVLAIFGLAGSGTWPADPSQPRTDDRCAASDDPLLLDYRPLPTAGPDPDGSGLYRPLNRQAVLFGLTQVNLSVCPSSAGRREVGRFTVALGAVPLCRVDRTDETCVIDFGTDLGDRPRLGRSR